MSKPEGIPEWIQRQIADTRSQFASPSALAERAPSTEEPQVERAWARTDGRVEFLLSFGGGKTARVTKTLEYARLCGGPTYQVSMHSVPYEDYAKTRTLVDVAAVRFERTHEPEKHNVYIDWDKVQPTGGSFTEAGTRKRIASEVSRRIARN